MSDRAAAADRGGAARGLRGAAAAQLRVEDVIVADRRLAAEPRAARAPGLAPGTEDERDLEQLRSAIEGARALLPLVEAALGPDAAPLRDALSQLQMAYARRSSGRRRGGAASRRAGAARAGEQPEPGDRGPRSRSGRLWVPGQ